MSAKTIRIHVDDRETASRFPYCRITGGRADGRRRRGVVHSVIRYAVVWMKYYYVYRNKSDERCTWFYVPNGYAVTRLCRDWWCVRQPSKVCVLVVSSRKFWACLRKSRLTFRKLYLKLLVKQTKLVDWNATFVPCTTIGFRSELRPQNSMHDSWSSADSI